MAFMPEAKTNSFNGFLDMWKKLSVVELIPTYLNDLKLGIEGYSVNSIINSIFCCCLLFGSIYYCFHKFFNVFLKSTKIKRYKWRQTCLHIWNISFFAASSFFLDLYHSSNFSKYQKGGAGSYYPQYENILFFVTEDFLKIKFISIILTTFYLTSAALDCFGKDWSEAATKILYGGVLMVLYNLGFENFLFLLNINLGVFYLITEIITLVSLHTAEDKDIIFRLFVVLRFMSWCYFFLNILPFNYLIPILYAKNFKTWLNLFCWLWYGSCIWNSPLLKYYYHYIFHTNPTDCIGGESVLRCILLKDSFELRHYKNLEKAVLELKLAFEKNKLYSIGATEKASVAAFQTIKCMMTLKRKLRRIRERKENESVQ